MKGVRMDDKHFLSVKETAAQCNLSPATVKVYCWRGAQAKAGRKIDGPAFMNAVKPARDWLIPVADVEYYKAHEMGKAGKKKSQVK